MAGRPVATSGKASVVRALKQHSRQVDPTLVSHTVQVTSYGGSGTTALCEHLAAAGLDLPQAPGYFPFKHQRRPPDPAEVPSGFRAIYLHSDPRNAVLSIFRRGIQVGHYRGLQMVRRPPDDVLHRLSSLETFLDAGTDDFELEDHVDQWLGRGAPDYPVLALALESLADAWPEVCTFVGLSPDHPCLPPGRRGSDWRLLPRGQRERLDRMYGGLARRLAAMPPVRVLP